MNPQPDQVPTSTAGSPSAADWPVRAADLVETLVGVLRDKTVRPLTLVARAVVFGVIVLASTVVTVVLVSVALVRLLDVYVFNGRVWAADFSVGAVFVVVGLLAWSRRSQRGTDHRADR
jgi:hypothetical protein